MKKATAELGEAGGNRYAEKLGLRFVLPDYLQEVYQKVKIDLPRMNGESYWSLAMPARTIADQQGKVIAADYDPNYTTRPEAEKTVEDLKSIG